MRFRGEKRRRLFDDFISRFIPDNINEYIYVEPFGGTFSVNPDTETEQLGRGTRIVLHLKEDMQHYLDEKNLKKSDYHFLLQNEYQLLMQFSCVALSM